jgi:hypothetical protein
MRFASLAGHPRVLGKEKAVAWDGRPWHVALLPLASSRINSLCQGSLEKAFGFCNDKQQIRLLVEKL